MGNFVLSFKSISVAWPTKIVYYKEVSYPKVFLGIGFRPFSNIIQIYKKKVGILLSCFAFVLLH